MQYEDCEVLVWDKEFTAELQTTGRRSALDCCGPGVRKDGCKETEDLYVPRRWNRKRKRHNSPLNLKFLGTGQHPLPPYRDAQYCDI